MDFLLLAAGAAALKAELACLEQLYMNPPARCNGLVSSSR